MDHRRNYVDTIIYFRICWVRDEAGTLSTALRYLAPRRLKGSRRLRPRRSALPNLDRELSETLCAVGHQYSSVFGHTAVRSI
jgi:hypothetical protein